MLYSKAVSNATAVLFTMPYRILISNADVVILASLPNSNTSVAHSTYIRIYFGLIPIQDEMLE